MIKSRRAFVTMLGSAALVPGLLRGAHADVKVPKGFQALPGTQGAPKAFFADQQGRHVGIQSFEGKPVVLNLWATWCAPCVQEMPSLARLVSRLNQEEAAVLPVSQDKGGAAVAMPFLDRLGIKALPIYFDPAGLLYRQLGVRGLPTSFIVNGKGHLVARVEGIIEWDDAEVVNYITSQKV